MTNDADRPLNWKGLYTQAMLEMDPAKLPSAITRANDAILDRIERFDRNASGHELSALNDALNNLRLLRQVYERGMKDIGSRLSANLADSANATLLDAVGTPLGTVQSLLGHSSSEITREIYLHSIPSDARAAVQKIEDLLIGPKWTQVLQISKTGSSLIQ
jgi:integrase